MLGLYENFPQNIHFVEKFGSSLAKKKNQEKLIEVLQKINTERLSFEQVGVPTLSDCTVIFEFGIAGENGFTFLGDEEAKNIQHSVEGTNLSVLDWFCGVRYYKNVKPKKTPLKFDYYMLRVGFDEKGTVEFLVYHERGPRYVLPQDLVAFIARRMNEASKKKNLKPKTS